MGKRDRLAHDEDLEWLLQSSEAVLGRQTAFREGGQGSRSSDYERGITDVRFVGKDATVQRARTLGARFAALTKRHRDVLAVAYGITEQVLRMQVLDAFNMQAWQAVERSFGPIAPVALLLTQINSEDPPPSKRRPSWNDLAKAGPWRSAAGLAFVALCIRNDASEIEAEKRRSTEAIDEALEAWRGPAPPKEEKRREKRESWTAARLPPQPVFGYPLAVLT